MRDMLLELIPLEPADGDCLTALARNTALVVDTFDAKKDLPQRMCSDGPYLMSAGLDVRDVPSIPRSACRILR